MPLSPPLLFLPHTTKVAARTVRTPPRARGRGAPTQVRNLVEGEALHVRGLELRTVAIARLNIWTFRAH